MQRLHFWSILTTLIIQFFLPACGDIDIDIGCIPLFPGVCSNGCISTERPISVPIKYHFISYCFEDKEKQNVCGSEGKLTTISEKGEIKGYKFQIPFEVYNLSIEINKPIYSNSEYPVDSEKLKVQVENFNYDKVTGNLLITKWENVCTSRIDDCCWIFYVNLYGAFEFTFINFGEDKIEETEDDKKLYFKSGLFYPE